MPFVLDILYASGRGTAGGGDGGNCMGGVILYICTKRWHYAQKYGREARQKERLFVQRADYGMKIKNIVIYYRQTFKNKYN